jgi:hypothetical protein
MATHVINVLDGVEQTGVIVAVPVSKHATLNGVEDLFSCT